VQSVARARHFGGSWNKGRAAAIIRQHCTAHELSIPVVLPVVGRDQLYHKRQTSFVKVDPAIWTNNNIFTNAKVAYSTERLLSGIG
jgi:hypothetical protein